MTFVGHTSASPWKGVYFRCENSFHFWLTAFLSALTHAFLWEQHLPPDVQYRSPISWDGGSSYVSDPSLSHHGSSDISFCLFFLWIVGCRHHPGLPFPSQDCPETVTLHSVEPCRDARSHTEERIKQHYHSYLLSSAVSTQHCILPHKQTMKWFAILCREK